MTSSAKYNRQNYLNNLNKINRLKDSISAWNSMVQALNNIIDKPK